jgi:Zn-dependent protease with chaperone function
LTSRGSLAEEKFFIRTKNSEEKKMVKIFKPLRIFYFLTIMQLLTSTGCNSLSKATTTPLPQATRDPVLEQTIEKQLETMNPAAVSVYREATTAMDAGDYERSYQLYEEVLTMAPNFSTAYRRLGYIELESNNVDRSIELLRKAMELEPDAYNQTALAYSLLQKDTPRDSQEAFELASTAAKSLPDDEQTITIWLMSAFIVKDIEALRQADEQLLQIAPYNPVAHYFAGALAASDGKWEKAETELLYSQRLGMDPENVRVALNSGIARNAMLFRFFRWGSIALAIWLIGLGVLYQIGSILSKATMRALNNAQSTMNTQVKPEEHRVRSIYRTVVTLLSLYYYISIPFVILLLLLVVGGIFYLFLHIGMIPTYVVGILLFMLIGSLFAILRSLFSKSRNIPPGRPLRRMDAPELWTLAEDVARKLAIRPVDAIFITPGVGIGVNETGSILHKMRGTGQRNLILGMGILSGLTQGQFAAILAHEYGHFSNRDTAGGNLAHQVYASLHQMAQRLIQSRSAQFFNPVWLFVVGYQRIFLRVTLGASRLQEILADRYAATAYGSTNFIEGLQYLIRQTIAFPLQANYEIKNSFEQKRPIVNLYGLPMQEDLSGELKKQFEEAMKRTTSAYDSHPAPQERIEWIERLHISYSPMHDNPNPALRLFPNPEELQREMTSQITSNL